MIINLVIIGKENYVLEKFNGVMDTFCTVVVDGGIDDKSDGIGKQLVVAIDIKDDLVFIFIVAMVLGIVVNHARIARWKVQDVIEWKGFQIEKTPVNYEIYGRM